MFFRLFLIIFYISSIFRTANLTYNLKLRSRYLYKVFARWIIWVRNLQVLARLPRFRHDQKLTLCSIWIYQFFGRVVLDNVHCLRVIGSLLICKIDSIVDTAPDTRLAVLTLLLTLPHTMELLH